MVVKGFDERGDDKKRVVIECTDGVVQQQFKDDCDINKIVARAEKGMMINNVQKREVVYGDVSEIPDFKAARDIINKATDDFMKLDPYVRERFNNDPGELLEFIEKEENFDEGVKLGLFKEKIVEKVSEPAKKIEEPIK